jgi:hypothetical protein
MMSYQTNNSYGYQRPNPIGYGQQPQGGMPMMGSAGVYGGAPVVSFPAPPAAPLVPQAKPYYRCWDNNQKKWFYWEKDSTVTTWTEPPAHITLIDHETGSIVQRDQTPIVSRPSPPVVETQRQFVAPVSQAASTSVAPVATSASTASQPVTSTTTSSKPQRQQSLSSTSAINPNYSAGVSRYTPAGASTSGSAGAAAAAAEKARLEEADRIIAEQLQKQLSMEAEAELVASCPLPGEAAKMLASSKKKPTKASASVPKADEDKIIADMAHSGFVIKKQKQKAKQTVTAGKS